MAAAPQPGLARAVLATALVAGVAVFIAALIASIRATPGIGGVLTGVFAGLFGGLLVAAVGAWLGMRLAAPPVATPVDVALGESLASGLAPLLAELDATRLELNSQANVRATWRVPLGTAGGALYWVWNYFSDESAGVLELLIYLGIGGVGGYFWAIGALSARYTRLYKDRVLPRLAAGFGSISYRLAVVPDLSRLQTEHVVEAFDDASAVDELFGTWRGLDISILELSLHKGSGDDRQTVFDGLIAQVTLPRGLTGVTAVVADDGLSGTLRDWLASGPRQRVRVEDPEFEAAWQVYGTDQIAARALLTPAFMARFKQLAARPGFGRPLALADGNRLLIALPSYGSSLFAAPNFRAPAASRDTLITLHGGIAALLATIDAVIDLDHAARGTAARQPGASAASTSV